MFKTISLIAADRADYLNQVLDGLKSNDLTGYKLFIGLEPVSEECKAICEGIDFIEREIIYNPEVLGLNKNPYCLLEYVFKQGSELNYYLEDDVLPSPDMTQLANWYGGQEWADDVLCLSGFQLCSDPQQPEAIIFSPHFQSWGAVFTPKQWEQHLKPNWFNNPPNYSWDVTILEYGIKAGLKTLHPLFTRCKHIGLFGTSVKELNPDLLNIANMVINEEVRTFNYAVKEPVKFFLHASAAPQKSNELNSVLAEFVELNLGREGCRESRLLRHQEKETEFLCLQEWDFIGSFHQHLETLKTSKVEVLQQVLSGRPQIFFSAPADLQSYQEAV